MTNVTLEASNLPQVMATYSQGSLLMTRRLEQMYAVYPWLEGLVLLQALFPRTRVVFATIGTDQIILATQQRGGWVIYDLSATPSSSLHGQEWFDAAAQVIRTLYEKHQANRVRAVVSQEQYNLNTPAWERLGFSLIQVMSNPT